MSALGARGLNVVLPLDALEFDAACAPVPPALRLASLLPGARAAVIVGSGGPAFFDRFAGQVQAGLAPGPHPLDRHTRASVEEAARVALAPLGVAWAAGFPFLSASSASPAPAAPVIPFQRLGRAAGLGGPGPLGLQIHPRYGPWWAYRGLIAVDRPLPPAAPVGDGCAGCHAPCVAACPAAAVQRTGFVIPACHARRLVAEPCRLSCAARIACIRGPEHRYRDEELAFHMAASLPDPRRALPTR